MRIGIQIISIAVLILFFQAVMPALAQYEELVNRTRPAVVLVAIESDRGISTGSGFFVDSRGYVLTARHVIEDAKRVVVLTAGRRQLPAIIVRYSNLFDTAILKVEGSGFPTLTLGNSESVRIGQEILVLGYPFAGVLGMESITVTRGIISAIRPTEGLLQIDAALNPGNSGGPVLNLRGEVVGIAVAAVRGGQALNFAVPSNLARTITADLSPVAIPAPSRTGPQGATLPSPPAQPAPQPPRPAATPTPPPPETAPPTTPSPPVMGRPAAPNDRLIVPGERIGAVRIGDSIDDSIRVFGEVPDALTALPPGRAMGGIGYQWRNRLYAVVDKETRIIMLAGVWAPLGEFGRPPYIAQVSIGLGSSENEVVTTYGFPDIIELRGGAVVYVYQRSGVGFFLGWYSGSFFQRVNEIFVFQPGTYR